MLKNMPLCLAIVLGATVSADAQNSTAPGFPVGAAEIGASYHFTSDPPEVEEAKVMAGLGAKMHKFNLAPLTTNKSTLLHTAQQDPGVVAILAQLFAPQYLQTNYDEIYDLVVLLRTV